MAQLNRRSRRKKSGGRFVQMYEWVMRSAAWNSLKPGPRALYLEIKRRYNGTNNGEIVLSHRQAAELLNVHRNTVGPWFDTLIARGFIELACGPHLGSLGIGKASVWRLTEEPSSDRRPASKTFMQWSAEKQKPRTRK